MFIILTGKPRPSGRGGFTLFDTAGKPLPQTFHNYHKPGKMTMKQNISHIFLSCIILLFLLGGFAGIVYASPFKGPWGDQSVELQKRAHSPKQTIYNFNPLWSLVELYRKYISPIDGKECPMYPSCSRYSLLCFEKHGPFIGWMMTCDRLLHERDEMREAPLIYINGAERFYDPLENNDFWWHSEH